MVTQYPYTLKIWKETPATFDQNTAEWVGGTSEWVEVGRCRDEVNNGGQKIKKTDGSEYVFSAAIYLPQNTEEIGRGVKIQVWNGDNLRLEAEAVMFVRNQLNAKIWV